MMSMFSCSQIQPMSQVANISPPKQVLEKKLKEKAVIVLGATGTGKTKLSLALAEKYSGEIINSDKMQVYEGLDIVTNKVTQVETRGIPHHLLSVIERNVDFSATHFCTLASLSLQSITGNEKVPVIVGGSNSYIESLVNYHQNMFHPRYEFCCLWVDVSIPVLNSTLSDRVDQMVAKGLVDEVREMFDPNLDYSKGVYRSIGVQELDHYFRVEKLLDNESRAKILEEALYEIKLNTHKLAFQQKEKIQRLKNVKNWKIHKLDATKVHQGKGAEAIEAWQEFVMDPSIKIVDAFLNNV